MSERFRALTKYLIASAIFVALFYFVDLSALLGALTHLSPSLIVLLLLISVLLVYVSALKWHYFLAALGPAESVIKLFKLYLLGYFINLLLPSYVGGDAVRSVYAGKKTGKHAAFAATILERYTGFVAMVVFAFCFVWQAARVTTEIKLFVVACAVGLVVGTFTVLSPAFLAQLDKVKPLSRITPHLKKVQAAFHIVRESPTVWCKTLALSLLFHSLTVVNVVVAASAVGWINPPVQEIFVVLPIALLIGALPVTPNGLGIQEGAYVYFLTGVGATAEQALGIGLIFRAKGYLLAMVGGLIWGIGKVRAKQS